MTPPKKIALVLGGGGFVGAFQLGVLKVIEEAGIPIEKIIGVSVGAINGAGFLENNCSVQRLLKVWFSLEKPSAVFKLRGTFLVAESFYKVRPLEKLISILDTSEFIARPQELLVATTHIPSGKVVYFSTKDPEVLGQPSKMLRIIQASCSIFGVFPPVSIRHRGQEGMYIDGSSSHPLPILKAWWSGCDTIIAVRCHSDRLLKEIPKKAFARISFDMELKHNRMEKEEIKKTRDIPGLQLFVVEPDDLPQTLNTITFKRGDFQKAITEGERVGREELAPLIEHFSP